MIASLLVFLHHVKLVVNLTAFNKFGWYRGSVKTIFKRKSVMQENTDSIVMFMTFQQEIYGRHLSRYSTTSNLLVTVWCSVCYCGYFNP